MYVNLIFYIFISHKNIKKLQLNLGVFHYYIGMGISGSTTGTIEQDRIEFEHRYPTNYQVAKVTIKRDDNEFLILSWQDTKCNIWIVTHVSRHTFDDLMNLANGRGKIILDTGAILATDDEWFKYEHGGMITIWSSENMAALLREALLEAQKQGYTFKQE
jgi:hypothetical protein